MKSCAALMLAMSVLAWTLPASAQEPPESGGMRERTIKNGSGECLEPPPMLLRWEDYHGPYQKLVGTFARKLERKSAHSAHYRPGTVLCSLEVKDKFMLFVDDTFDPVSFLAAGFHAGIDQSVDRDPSFGQGSEGYARRFGADFESQTNWRFFTDFAYPVIFSEDPRYYPLSQGSAGARLLHAAEHAVVAHRDDGTHMFNFSLWFGTASAVALSDLIHPGNARGVGAGARAMGFSIANGIGMDIIREFAPEIARKLHLPFRDSHGAVTTPAEAH